MDFVVRLPIDYASVLGDHGFDLPGDFLGLFVELSPVGCRLLTHNTACGRFWTAVDQLVDGEGHRRQAVLGGDVRLASDLIPYLGETFTGFGRVN